MKWNGIQSNITEQIKALQEQIERLNKELVLEQFVGDILLHADSNKNTVEWYVNYFSKDREGNHIMHVTECVDDVFKQRTLSLFIDQSNSENIEEAIKTNFIWKTDSKM